MSEESQAPLTAEERLREREAFNKVAEAIESLSEDARIRVFRILATHFDLPFGQDPYTSRPTAAGPTPSGASQTSSFSEDRSLSPKQFMIQKKPTTDVERIACLAYYLT